MKLMAWIAKDNERVNVGGGLGAVSNVGGRNVTADSVSGFLGRVYRTMALGLAVTGVVALAVASSPGAMQYLVMNRGIVMVLVIAQFVTVLAFTGLLNRVSA